jgi:hypothetical protein
VCGLLETSVRLIVDDFAAAHSRPELAQFVSSRTSRFSEISRQELSTFVHSFSNTWGQSLDVFLDGEAGAALDSLKNIRNHVAHGKNFGTSLGQIDRYAAQVGNVIDFLDNLFA